MLFQRNVVGGNVTRGNVFTGNCAFGEMVHGETKYGELVRGIIRLPKVHNHTFIIDVIIDEILEKLDTKKNKFRSSTVMVLKMFFFRIQKCSLFEKNCLFSGTNHDLCY
jgi:hypothetical protein